MNEMILETIKVVNPIQLGLIALIGFYYYNRIKLDMKELRTELKADISDLRTEFKADISDLRTEMKDIRGENEKLENKLMGEIKETNRRLDSLYQLITSIYIKRDAA